MAVRMILEAEMEGLKPLSHCLLSDIWCLLTLIILSVLLEYVCLTELRRTLVKVYTSEIILRRGLTCVLRTLLASSLQLNNIP